MEAIEYRRNDDKVRIQTSGSRIQISSSCGITVDVLSEEVRRKLKVMGYVET